MAKKRILENIFKWQIDYRESSKVINYLAESAEPNPMLQYLNKFIYLFFCTKIFL
jgi:hypothetical protein